MAAAAKSAATGASPALSPSRSHSCLAARRSCRSGAYLLQNACWYRALHFRRVVKASHDHAHREPWVRNDLSSLTYSSRPRGACDPRPACSRKMSGAQPSYCGAPGVSCPPPVCAQQGERLCDVGTGLEPLVRDAFGVCCTDRGGKPPLLQRTRPL